MKLSAKQIRYSLITLLILATISIVIYAAKRAWPEASNEMQPLTSIIQPRDFVLKIYADGELQPVESIPIGVPYVPMQRLKIYSVVSEGRHVNKGDILVEFDPTELDLEMLEQRATLDVANQKIEQRNTAVNIEQSDIVKDKKLSEMELGWITEFQPRDPEIFTKRKIIEGELDKDFTEKKIVFADARLTIKGKVFNLNGAILQLERGMANARIGQLEQGLASLKLISPSSGVVVYPDMSFFFGNMTIQPGRTVFVGQTMFNLVKPDKMQAKIYVLEKDAGELRVGQPVTLTLDPFPGKKFTGKVKNIDNLARPIDIRRDSPIKYFQTTVELDATDPELMKPGIKLKAEINAGELKSAIVVPRSALIKKESDSYVYIKNGSDKFEQVKVKLGQGDGIQTVVKEGLKKGQILALNPPDVKRDSNKKSKEN